MGDIMVFSNWSKFASGVKGNGMQRVRKGKKAERKGKASGTMAAKRRKKSRKNSTAEAPVRGYEAKWKAEADAEALTRASEILKSPDRLKKAKRIAEEKAVQAQEVADGIKQIGEST